MLLVEKMERLQKAHPNISKNGQLYKHKSETLQSYASVTLWTLFVSSENTHLLRDHVFRKSRPFNAAEWSQWFSENLADIHKNAVLPGIAVRTNKQWTVQRILGWVGDAEYAAEDSSAYRKRHKAKNKRRKNG